MSIEMFVSRCVFNILKSVRDGGLHQQGQKDIYE